jgi:tetratricopeptide (TPR) repeat protein
MIGAIGIFARSRTLRADLLAVVCAIVLLGHANAVAADWADGGWQYRRPVTIGFGWRSPDLPGDDIAVLTMPTAGLCSPAGSDIRVMNGQGVQTPTRILMVGPGDTVRLAFAIQPSTTRYYVYMGNTKPPTPRKELDIRRGVLMETWEYLGGPAGDLEQARNIFADLKAPIGRCMRDRIYLGYNPFGPQDRIASLFTGYLLCPTEGAYTFACSSQNASFLLIDDKLLVDNGGSHRPQHDVGKQAKVTLTAGLHKMTFYHISPQGEPIVAVAWQPPGADKIEPIPARGFAPFVGAVLDPVEQYGKDLTIDFIPAFGGETMVAQRYCQRYSFSAMHAGAIGDPVQWQWDFGDGQTSEKQSVDHVYLAAGQYTVALTARVRDGVLKRTNKITVARPWDDILSAVQDKPALQAKIVGTYDFAALSPQANAQAIMLLDKGEKFDDLARAGLALVARPTAPDDAISEALPSWAEAMVLHGKADKAADGLLAAAKMTASAAVQAAMTARAARVCLDDLGDPTRAMALFEEVLAKCPTAATPTIRQARIGVGDVCRCRGDYDRALEAYQGAKPLADADRKIPVVRGDCARHIEAYLRSNECDEASQWLSRWGDALPADKLDGYWSLLRVRLLLAQSRPVDATIEGQTLVKVNPSSNYAPAILLQCADAYDTMRQPAKARETLKQLVDKYPESSLAADAARRMASPASKPAGSVPSLP